MYYGEKVKLRAFEIEDAKVLHKFINDFEVKNNLSLKTPLPISLIEEDEFIRKNKCNINGSLNFAIEDLESSKLIGSCGLADIDLVSRHAKLGIMIGDKEYWNKGYGKDIIRTLLSIAFNQIGLNKVKLGVFEYNKRAIKCYEKVGFKIVGVEKEDIYRNGRYYDHYIMEIFKRDIRER